MKHVLALFIIGGLLCGPTVIWAQDIPFDKNQVPEECMGQHITCEDNLIGNCTAMYCPGSTTYDSNGEIISRTGPCNKCVYFRQCYCENGKVFTITLR